MSITEIGVDVWREVERYCASRVPALGDERLTRYSRADRYSLQSLIPWCPKATSYKLFFKLFGMMPPNPSAGLDGGIVRDPLTIDFSRKFPIPHAAFSNGPHTCPGAVLARREIEVFIREWLPRIPDFEVTGPTRMASIAVNGVESLPLRWPCRRD